MKKYDVVATVGTYEKDGQKKYINRNVGSIIETKHGDKMKLDACFNPAGCPKGDDGSIWLALFEPREKEQKPSRHEQQKQNGYQQQPEEPPFNPDDDIPF